MLEMIWFHYIEDIAQSVPWYINITKKSAQGLDICDIVKHKLRILGCIVDHQMI